MRLSPSKVFVEALSEVSENAEKTGLIDVDSLISNPEIRRAHWSGTKSHLLQVIRPLRELWAHIPAKARRKIGQRPHRTRCERAPTETRQKDAPKIGLSPSFFKEDGNELIFGFSPIVEMYRYLDRLSLQWKIDTIRARFTNVILHRLKERLGSRYLRSANVDDAVTTIGNSDLVGSDADEIKQKLVRWTDLGRGTDVLFRSIGSSAVHENLHLGNIFCLPDDYYNGFIRTSSLAGPERDREIQNIKERGILEIQARVEIDRLAADVLDYLWAKIDASIEDIVRRSR
ncbi:hypothetical protein BDV06DRAFT_217538 [Aspergillus oleicola]